MIPLRARGAVAVADAWNAAVPNKYRLDRVLIEANLFAHPLFHEEASLWDGDTFVAVKRSASSLYDGPDPKVAHLSLLGAFTEAVLQASVERLREDGYETLVIGQDSGHFLPGAPTDIPWIGTHLKGQGFEPGGLAFDLQRDLSVPLPHRGEGVDRASLTSRTVLEADLDVLEAFFKAEFPARWHYDVGRKIGAEGPSSIYGLFEGEACRGFALLQTEGCALPIGGAVWQSDLGPSWGSLGPIGISSSLRGAGLGRAFLNAALGELQRRGARQTIIDWTGLVDFYGTQGFSVNRAYRSYRLNLRADRPPEA